MTLDVLEIWDLTKHIFCITFDALIFLQIYWVQFLIAEVVPVFSNGFGCYHRINPKSFRECETSVVLWNGDQ